MAVIVDRRDMKGNAAASRQRFLKRYRGDINKRVEEMISEGNITDIGKGGAEITPSEDISEPHFRSGPGGDRQIVHPGNKEFQAGDRIAKPKRGEGEGGGGKASKDGSGKDQFKFRISEEEFFSIFFDNLELPNLNKRTDSDTEVTQTQNAGHVSQGPFSNFAPSRSRAQRQGRFLAQTGPHNQEVLALLKRQQQILEKHDVDYIAPEKKKEWLPLKYEVIELEKALAAMYLRVQSRLTEEDKDDLLFLDEEIKKHKDSLSLIPSWIESTDMQFRHKEKVPVPSAKAVMFCLMDVSGSMTEERKNQAKIFYILLHRFLLKHYEKVDVIFLRYHTEAKEVDEQEFFYGEDTGGTAVVSGMNLMESVMQRYPESEWNIYGAHATDGDSWGPGDSRNAGDILARVIQKMQGYFYTEITKDKPQSLWDVFAEVMSENAGKMWMANIKERKDIYPVFREFFKKRGVGEGASMTSRMAAPAALTP